MEIFTISNKYRPDSDPLKVKASNMLAAIGTWRLPISIVLALGWTMMTGGCSGKTDFTGIALPNLQPIPPGVQYWRNHFIGGQLIKWAEDDLNADGRRDIVVIYRADDKKCKMLIVVKLADGYRLTDPVPAPVSNQQISFKNFDSKPPMEVVVTGKNANYVGIAIFRLEHNQLINLFEDDYDKCC